MMTSSSGAAAYDGDITGSPRTLATVNSSSISTIEHVDGGGSRDDEDDNDVMDPPCFPESSSSSRRMLLVTSESVEEMKDYSLSSSEDDDDDDDVGDASRECCDGSVDDGTDEEEGGMVVKQEEEEDGDFSPSSPFHRRTTSAAVVSGTGQEEGKIDDVDDDEGGPKYGTRRPRSDLIHPSKKGGGSSSSSFLLQEEGSEPLPEQASSYPYPKEEEGRGGRAGVTFTTIEIREYNQIMGDNPACSYGAPLSLDWTYTEYDPLDLDLYEATRLGQGPKKRRRFFLSKYQRRDMLLLWGYTREDITAVSREMRRIRQRRTLTIYMLPVDMVVDALVTTADRACSGVMSKAEERRQSLNDSLHGSMRKIQFGGIGKDDNDAKKNKKKTNLVVPSGGGGHQHKAGEEEGVPLMDTTNMDFSGGGIRHPGRMPQIHVVNPLDSTLESTNGDDNSGVGGEEETTGSTANLHHDYLASGDSDFDRYSVRVDKTQHDKSMEITLCSLRRPHMRAFHASWVSFFVAFFMWFAITPLLSEVQTSLDLTHSQIWTSSLCGTVSTIIMRIIMGPMCDKFGSRKMMALILICSAIPTAMTGLVKTSAGLSTVRAFIGIAGSSFVACQYWTSTMFTREVAGTANALVAGWGNLGGGLTQIIMGSVLFPLFKMFYGGTTTGYTGDGSAEVMDPEVTMRNAEAAEKSWRTVFIVPAFVSVVTAIVIVVMCDDSPKGQYNERTMHQFRSYVHPCQSLMSVLRRWNVWILFLQYAACFGTEVTMTNATALYFKEEFNQTTESAAAIASIFGVMNLFARGIGGFFSDLCNARYGVRGRFFWQFFTLFIQGIGIVIFGLSRTLAGSIVALVFASLFVQGSEGSTFGIVPHVSRRYTGSVVGFIGAGGNVGGAIFAAIFRDVDYRLAYVYMGSASIVVSFLSFLLKQTKVERFW